MTDHANTSRNTADPIRQCEPTRQNQPRAFEYETVVCFQETNVVGNVYFAEHIKWQGRCREMFLHQYAADVLDALYGTLRLVTLRCNCEYFAELVAFDRVVVRMRLKRLVQNRIALEFDYVRVTPQGEELVARGEQEIASMVLENGQMAPTPIPESLRAALIPFAAGGLS